MTNKRVRDLTPLGVALSGTDVIPLDNGVLAEVGTTTVSTVSDFVIDALDPIKSAYFQADYGSNDGDRRSRSVGSTGAFRFNFNVALDFDQLVSLELEGAPTAGAAGAGKDIDLTSDYGALGQDKAFHSETDTASVFNTGVTSQLFALDLSSVFSVLAAGDSCGVMVDHNGIGGSIDYYGIRLRYRPL